ncbi:MAG: hypothetical protein P5687_24730, partial [Limnospira sp. PMC 1042.18]|nr:hypothetical protein [Limnospira sp. PMC 1042.18]
VTIFLWGLHGYTLDFLFNIERSPLLNTYPARGNMIQQLTITVLVENTAGGKGLLGEHGPSILVELEFHSKSEV